MITKKSTGSYYTPSYLTDFISVRVLAYFKKNRSLSILEPSAGPGPFVKSLDTYSADYNINLTAVDINKVELKNINDSVGKNKVKKKKIDFLNFKTSESFDVVIGNPPYVKKMLLSKEQREKSKEMHKENDLSESSAKNLWATFLIKSSTYLTDDGVLAFVLPAEILQVSFAKEIREFLKRTFERIEIFTFDELQFDCKGQDTIVLFAYKKSKDKGEYFTNIKNKSVLIDNKFTLKQNKALVNSNIKWTHHFLSKSDLAFLSNLRNKFKNIGDYCTSSPGVVTGANDFFIMSKEVEKESGLQQYTKPIIQKGFFVNGGVVFSQSDMRILEKELNPSRLLVLKDDTEITKDLKEYFKSAEVRGIPERHKCRNRNNWYVIPNVSTPPQAMFFKRSHLYPKIVKNNTKVFVTDSAYKIEMKDGFDVDSFIYSFYNSLTLLFSEIEGRYYGGGVLELIPSEFKNLPLPYVKIKDKKFAQFSEDFLKKDDIDEILKRNDSVILKSAMGLTEKDILRITELHKKFLEKRLRK